MSNHNYRLSTETSRKLLGSFSISYILAMILIFLLIHNGGFWNLAANTRVLDVLIDAGIIPYTDKDAGIIEGVDHLKYYMYSQDAIKWNIVGLVSLIFFIIWGLRALQFSIAARFNGLEGTTGEHSRSFFYGKAYNLAFPFYFGYMAKAHSLEPDDNESKFQKSTATLFTMRFFLFFEIAFFAILGLLYIGWGSWFTQLFWASFIAYVSYKVTYGKDRFLKNCLPALQSTLKSLSQNIPTLAKLSLLSIVVFALEDIAAYFCAQAFTSHNIILNVEFKVLLMALVAGCIARFFPITPGGIGQFEWGFATALYIGGLGFPEAATIAILDSFFRYATLAIIFLVVNLRYQVKTSYLAFTEKLDTYLQKNTQKAKTKSKENLIPQNFLVSIPDPVVLWSRIVLLSIVCLGVYFFNELTILFMDKWLMESLNLSSVFWTNFNTGAVLFILGGVPCALGIIAPAWANNLTSQAKKLVSLIAIFCGLIGGYILATKFHLILQLFYGTQFGETDPVFDKDLGFYINALNGIWLIWTAIFVSFGLAFVSSIFCSYAANRDSKRPGISGLLSKIGTKITLVNLALCGVALAVGEYLSKYDLLIKDNEESAVYNGAEYIDVDGFFSNLSYIYITTLALFAVTFIFVKLLKHLHANQGDWAKSKQNCTKLIKALAIVIILDFAFKGMVVLRDVMFVQPNEPVIQLGYIQRHIDATLKGYQLDKVEVVSFSPNAKEDPLPSIDKVLASPSIKNAPLWPGYVSYLDTYTDPQHSQRIMQTSGDTMIYGPTLEIVRQEQKLRTYYNFLNVDNVRYNINGEKQMFISAVRELPLLEPQQWLAWWGQRFMLFTHGHGIVMAPAAAIIDGNPEYVSKNIPSTSKWPELKVDRAETYFGEGSATMAYSKVKDVPEFDYPTEQDRAEVTNSDNTSGVIIDSLWKRIVIGWRSDQLFDMVFSNLIEKDETRVIYSRTPIERLERIAPFLHFDTNPYAVVVDGKIIWMINAMTISDRFPYSKHEYIGDKSAERTFKRRPSQKVNYVEDSVKATINGYTGEVKLYKNANCPLLNTWSSIYPDLFTEKKEMPQSVAAHLTYPVHLFHVQFDDIYIVYHMKKAMTFFNMEDMWDDADEVLGPILDTGKAITFSIEPYNCILETGTVLPKTKEKNQYSLAMAFTPEKAMNLRAIPIAYQDGEDYGRLISLQIPKGEYVVSPEQADSIIDQDPDVSEKISWWNRQGCQVVRGHTTLLIVENEIIYIEPIFIRSQQNAASQLKRVVVVVRGKAYMDADLESALKRAFFEMR